MNAPVLEKVCCDITTQDRDYCDVTFGIIPGVKNIVRAFYCVAA